MVIEKRIKGFLYINAKSSICFFIFSIACSSPKEEKQVPFSVLPVNENEWAVYEGRVVNESGYTEDIELSLQQAAVGIDSYFKLYRNEKNPMQAISFNSQGTYSVSYGLAKHEQGITVHCKAKGFPQRTIVTESSKKIKIPEVADGDDLYLLTEGADKLIITDNNFKPIKNSFNALHRRLNYFTAEGYVTADSTTSEFYERNTGEKWNLAKLVEYDSIKKVYQQLSTEKNEGIYLKALAYSIEDADSTNTSHKSIVIKRILRLEKSSRFNRIE
jgi:hypothetical protein